MAHENGEGVAAAEVPVQNEESARLSYALFRRPDKYRIGEDFMLFVRKLNLYFEAVELIDLKKRRLALLFNLSEDAFRLAESIDFPEEDSWNEFINKLKVLFERNQTDTEKRYNFNRRVQEPGETVDSFAVALREFGSKCGFTGAEYSHRIVDQFILGLRDRSTQSKLLQEPPENIDAALLIARRFEAANATMMKLNAESFEAKQQPAVRSVGSTRPAKVCFSCSGYGHVARECPTIRKNVAAPRERSNRYRVVCFKCNKQGHLARDCFQSNTSFSPNRQVNNQSFGRRSVTCFNCGQEGHISRFCNFPEAQNQNMRRSEQGESLQYDRQKPSEQTRPDSKVRLSSISATNKRKTLMIEASVNDNSCLCVVDTGASISLIGKSQWDILNKDSSCEMLPSDIVAEAANNSLIGIVGKTVLSVCVNGRQLSDQTFYVANDMKEIILGLDWMMSRHCVIDMPKLLISFPDGSAAPLLIHDSSIVDPMSVVLCEDIEIPGNHEVIKRAKVKTPFINDSILEPNISLAERGVLIARVLVSPVQQTVPIQIINPGAETIKLYRGTNIGSLEHVSFDDPAFIDEKCSEIPNQPRFDTNHLDPEERKHLDSLLKNYSDVFADKISDLGSTSLAEHKIDTGNAQPIKQLPRRLPNVLKSVVEEQVSEMLQTGVVRPSHSPWASPIVLVRKKDNTWRFCVDYRKLNDVTIKDSYMIPQVNDLLDTLSGQQYFTTLDLASGYWQVKVAEDSKEKTAFVIPGGQHLEFNRMPFGLANAVPTFQRLMQRVLEGLTPNKCLVYLDDVLIIGSTFEEHLQNLKEVLQAIKVAGLKLKPSKCFFAQRNVKYLGFIVSNEGLSPDPEKLKAIKEYPQPKDITELRRFVGLASYYRRFVSGFSEIVAPLHKLMQKDAKFIWNFHCEEAFQKLKEQLTTSPVLAFPNREGQFVLYTDASNVGIGAVLAQRSPDGGERVISYASKGFCSAEKNWTTTEKEAFAIVWALQYFHAYLYGVKVIVYSDHKALNWLRNFKHPNGKLARWILKLEQYDYEVIHRPSSLMGHVDALSRAPVQNIQISSWSPLDFKELQDLDSDIAIVKGWLLAENAPDIPPKDCSPVLSALYKVLDALFLQNGVLYHKWTDNTGIERSQIVIPKFFSKRIIHQVHTLIGHFGIHKTFDLLQKRFYWPGFHNDVENFCKSCEICLTNKVVPRPRKPLKPIDVQPIPFHMVGIDIVGPLKTTKHGNRYILSVIDYYTKYAEAEALPNQLAETVVRALETIFARHGMPSIIITDQGTNFESHLFSSMCKLFGIEKRRTTPYHPQTDGLCERFNSILKSLLRMRVNSEKDDWDEQLPSVLLSYRIAKQETTGVSPFELMYGREPRLPVDVRGEGDEEERKPVGGPAQYLKELKERHKHLKSFVQNRVQREQEKQKKNYDSRHRAEKYTDFVVGELVLLKNHRARGLDSKYVGPYRVVRVLEEDCEIECPRTHKRRVVHVNNLRPFSVDRVEPEYNNELLAESDGSDDDEFMYIVTKPAVGNENVLQEPVRYNLRRNRRQPDRYGVPIYDY